MILPLLVEVTVLLKQKINEIFNNFFLQVIIRVKVC